MTDYKLWCEPPKVVSVGSHTIGVLVSIDDVVGIGAVAVHLPSRYAETESLARIADRFGKAKVSEFLRNKLPRTQGARSGDLGEILATAYLEEDCGYTVGPSRLIHRDHQESTKTSLRQRLLARARERWPQLATVQVRHHGAFAYITGELANGTTLPLFRLRYNGSASNWGFAIYRASRDGYEDSILPSGYPFGTPQEALDCACGLYLNDTTAWLKPPTN